MGSRHDNVNQDLQVRLDKWLWAARFYKTRTLARNMIDGGKVHYNGQRSKPSKLVEVGAEIKLRQGFDEKTVIVVKLSEQRRGAPEAQALYRETDESAFRREQRSLERQFHAHNPSPDRRPDKKQRRDILKFRHSND
ncbi:heat-shock protein [Grimontia hollisae]|uniref:Heat shock protein 15 n=1 Tax=Grimontia hollisae CIP 101886 TaxID=675812 RepID=D0I315_GRIHO|nr:ribosome-associated heat shock protein Hsp15 [Grimontia hollisae]AMG30719.1 heat-shock protein [Grimontia hollisae]EEY74057.1 ribosome-associated heat shock protein [Grimontia hollisae CIP 101886]MDF2184871.1 ribosome-associated heat shock protein Hsp15 [Grimontia hollisae]